MGAGAPRAIKNQQRSPGVNPEVSSHQHFGDFNVFSISHCIILGTSGHACITMIRLKVLKGHLKPRKWYYCLDDKAYTFGDKGWEQAI